MTKKFLQNAKIYCEQNQFRFTESREAVLKIIAASKKPVGAYDILDKLQTKNKSAKPPTVYRAIDFWNEHGFIHKIESLNAFVTCHAGHNHNGSQFIVCSDCGQVEEVHLCHLPKDLQKKVNDAGFQMERWNTEIHGTCQHCQA